MDERQARGMRSASGELRHHRRGPSRRPSGPRGARGYHGPVTRPSASVRIGGVGVALATALVVVAVSIVPFLSPAWIAFEQDRADAAAWTGYAATDLRAVTGAILADLIVGPPDFEVELRGEPVLTPDERSHMRDVRNVFAGFAIAAVAAGVLVVAAFALARRRRPGWSTTHAWRAVRRGAIGLSLLQEEA